MALLVMKRGKTLSIFGNVRRAGWYVGAPGDLPHQLVGPYPTEQKATLAALRIWRRTVKMEGE